MQSTKGATVRIEIVNVPAGYSYSSMTIPSGSSTETSVSFTMPGYGYNITIYYNTNLYNLTIDPNGGIINHNLFEAVADIGSSSSMVNAGGILYYISNSEVYAYSSSNDSNDHYGHVPYWAVLTAGVNYTLSFKVVSLNPNELNHQIQAGMFLNGEYSTFYFYDASPTTADSTTVPSIFKYKFTPETTGRYNLRLDTNANNAQIRFFDIEIYASDSPTSESFVLNDNYNTSIAIPTPSRDGYTFDGWSVENSNGELIESLDNSYNFKFGVGDNKVTANWTRNTYTLSVDMNGGMARKNDITPSSIADDSMSTSNNNASISYDASKGQYNFDILSTSDPYGVVNTTVYLNAGTTYYMHARIEDLEGNLIDKSYEIFQVFYFINNATEEQSLKFTKDMTLSFSVGTTGEYRLRFDNDNGNDFVVKNFWITTNETFSSVEYSVYSFGSFQLTTPTRSGYQFAGWSITDGSGASVDGNVVTIGATNVIVSAIWKPMAYALTYDSNGGSVVASDYVRYSETYGKMNLYQPLAISGGYEYVKQYLFS